MNPATTRRFRRWTGLLGVGWALLPIFLSVSALLAPRSTLAPAGNCAFVGTLGVVQDASDEALPCGLLVARSPADLPRQPKAR